MKLLLVNKNNPQCPHQHICYRCIATFSLLHHAWTTNERGVYNNAVLTSYFDSWLFCETHFVNAMNETATESREMSPPDVTSRAFQHRCRQRNWGVPMAHWLHSPHCKGRMSVSEKNCIYFRPSSVKGVWVLNCAFWMKCVVAWENESTYVVFAAVCFCVSLCHL